LDKPCDLIAWSADRMRNGFHLIGANFPKFLLLAAKAELPIVTAVLQQHCGWTEAQSDRAIVSYQQFMRDNCIPDFVGDRD
jgi:hypothetical protein